MSQLRTKAPTIKQRKLAKEIIRGKARSKRELLANASYSEMTAKGTAQRTLEQDGVKLALQEYGFDENSAKRKVMEILNLPLDDIEVKGADILRATEQVFRVYGTFAPDKHIIGNVDLLSLLDRAEKAETKDKDQAQKEEDPHI